MSCPNPIEVAASWGVMVEHVDGLRRVRQLDPVVAADLVRYLGGDPEEARQDVAASILTVRGDRSPSPTRANSSWPTAKWWRSHRTSQLPFQSATTDSIRPGLWSL